MKPTYFIVLSIFLLRLNISAQEIETGENFGRTLNVGTGITYLKYVGYVTPIVQMNYEIQMDKNITVAPFFMVYSYNQKQMWGNESTAFQKYKYNETVIPVGLKVSYYFDELIKLDSKWDFYGSSSLGFIYRRTTWEEGYLGENQINAGGGPVYFDVHLGTEFHLNKTIGVQIDISSGISTIGLALHL